MNMGKISATTIEPGVTLLTKDGGKIGNAIVVKFDEEKQAWLIQTDFGSRVHKTKAEIEADFKLGIKDDYTNWSGWQIMLIMKNAGCPLLGKPENRKLADGIFRQIAAENKAENDAARLLNEEKRRQQAEKRKIAQQRREPPKNKSSKPASNGRELKIQKGGNIFDVVFNKYK